MTLRALITWLIVLIKAGVLHLGSACDGPLVLGCLATPLPKPRTRVPLEGPTTLSMTPTCTSIGSLGGAVTEVGKELSDVPSIGGILAIKEATASSVAY